MIVVQIGTNTASWEENGKINYDSCLEFVSKNHKNIDFLHLIEPLVECNLSIEKSYNFFNKKKIHNVAITDNPNQHELAIFRPSNIKTSGHSSSNYDHLLKHGHGEIEQTNIPCLTLDNFLKLNNIEKCDRLYIDTEGMDCLILLNYDNIKYQTNYIEFEVAHSDGPFSKSINAERCINKLIVDGFNITSSPNEPLNLIATR